MKLNTFNILLRAIRHYGKQSQVDKAIEEMVELIKELLKNRYGLDNKLAIAEEIADVKIMMEQLIIIFDCKYLVRDYVNAKLKRLNCNIDEEERKMKREYKLYFKFTFGSGVNEQTAYAEMVIGSSEKEIPYEVLAEMYPVEELAKYLGVAPERMEIITPEEYEKRWDG